MIFRQLFDATSSTYTYILASRRGGEAMIIDPVLERVDQYLRVLDELGCRLVKAVDTHVHADHITGLGALRDKTRCITVMGDQSSADVVSMRVRKARPSTWTGSHWRCCTPRVTRTIPTASFWTIASSRETRCLSEARAAPISSTGPPRSIRIHLQQAAEASGRDACVSRTRL